MSVKCADAITNSILLRLDRNDFIFSSKPILVKYKLASKLVERSIVLVFVRKSNYWYRDLFSILSNALFTRNTELQKSIAFIFELGLLFELQECIVKRYLFTFLTCFIFFHVYHTFNLIIIFPDSIRSQIKLKVRIFLP